MKIENFIFIIWKIIKLSCFVAAFEVLFQENISAGRILVFFIKGTWNKTNKPSEQISNNLFHDLNKYILRYKAKFYIKTRHILCYIY